MTAIDLTTLPVGTLLHLDYGIQARTTAVSADGTWVQTEIVTATGDQAYLLGSADLVHEDEIRSFSHPSSGESISGNFMQQPGLYTVTVDGRDNPIHAGQGYSDAEVAELVSTHTFTSAAEADAFARLMRSAGHVVGVTRPEPAGNPPETAAPPCFTCGAPSTHVSEGVTPAGYHAYQCARHAAQAQRQPLWGSDPGWRNRYIPLPVLR